MYATVVLALYLLVHESQQQSQSSLPQAIAIHRNEHTEIEPSVTDDLSDSPDNSFEGQRYRRSGQIQSQNQSRYDGDTNKKIIFGQTLNISRPRERNTTPKPKTTTEYTPQVFDYPVSGGEPLSTFTFSEDYDEFISKYGIEQALPLGGTESPKDEIGDRWTEPNDNQTNIATINPNWKPETATRNKDNQRLSWQVSVFSKQGQPFLRICGASMVSRATVISAAHCFWKEGEGLLPASQFAVGAGEVLTYRLDDYGSYRQQNDVGSIKVPPTFNGAATSYQHDIAVVQLAWPFYDTRGMRPVCVSFDNGLERKQLKHGNIATTLGASLLQKGRLTELQTLKVPFVSWEDCSRTLDKNTLQYFTEDKICAGFKPGTSPVLGEICTRDPGAGLAFFLGDNHDLTKGIAVPFLRGVASSSRPCDAGQRTLYTNIGSHRMFLEEHVQNVTEECGMYYPQLGAFLAKIVDERQFVCNCYC